ncbi:hypothetical protein [Thiothrix nivea]|uniref:Uncharacterized protein n=1 Tax=Thiothrix nivea (strain ATCC 35100 / DSM 5205 / JP2) TaxID=870187 RepID=A0A656HBW5_THINJ|nr:hypothetical protein [Thiothrix nivea]EIJ32940.1 hypothetical protein Thini_0282 [Thiothrix nivea DSM 5205]
MLRSSQCGQRYFEDEQNCLDFYTDYLSVTFDYATATGLTNLLGVFWSSKTGHLVKRI